MSKKSYKVAPEIKQEILKKLQTEDVSVRNMVDQYGVSDATIYTWLKKKTTGTVSRGEYIKVVKENRHLKELLGQTMLSMDMDKKRD